MSVTFLNFMKRCDGKPDCMDRGDEQVFLSNNIMASYNFSKGPRICLNFFESLEFFISLATI